MSNTHLTAAKRHAGGAALASRAEMAKTAHKRVDLAVNIVKNCRRVSRIGSLVNECRGNKRGRCLS
jgi:hypothetical protein